MKTKLGIIFFPIFCLLFSFAVLASDTTFTYLLLEPHAIEPTQQVMQYFANQGPLPPIFTREEAAHMGDVKNTIWSALLLLLVSVIVLIRVCSYQNWNKVFKYGTSILGGLILVAVLVPFDAFFRAFHQVVFAQGNWMFPADSMLIQLYPGSFFMNYGIALAVHALITAFLLLWLSQLGDKKTIRH